MSELLSFALAMLAIVLPLLVGWLLVTRADRRGGQVRQRQPGHE